MACLSVEVASVSLNKLGRTRSRIRARQQPLIEPGYDPEGITQWVETPKEDKDCVDCANDGGKFAAQVAEAKQHISGMYDGQMPVVIRHEFCDGILAGIKSKSAPYWNEDTRNCNTERAHVIAQCASIDAHFLETLESLCPNAGKSAPVDGFKPVKYMKVPQTDEEKEAEEEKEPIQPLGRGAEAIPEAAPGKPQWKNFPNAPSAEVDAKLARAQATPCDSEKDPSCAKTAPGAPSQYDQVVAEAAAEEAAKA